MPESNQLFLHHEIEVTAKKLVKLVQNLEAAKRHGNEHWAFTIDQGNTRVHVNFNVSGKSEQ